eukprot:1179362-Prorocentrum_minimum.AAC.2
MCVLIEAPLNPNGCWTVTSSGRLKLWRNRRVLFVNEGIRVKVGPCTYVRLCSHKGASAFEMYGEGLIGSMRIAAHSGKIP